MERLRRKTLPAWPDPINSLGQKVNTRTRRIGGSSVWFPRGPALEKYNETVRPEFERVLNNIELPEGEKMILKMYMIGRSEQRANPIVMICCPDKATRKKAEALIRQSDVLERQDSCGFGLGSTGFPLEASFLPRPLGKGIHLKLNNTMAAAVEVDVYGLTFPGIGRKLSFVTSSQGAKSVQYATGDPVVQLGDKLYQLTVAHAAKPSRGSIYPQQQDLDLDECEFEGQSDEEDDEHIILSRGSVSPGWPMRDADLDSDQAQSQQSSAYSESYTETPSSGHFQSPKSVSTKPVEMADEHDEWKYCPLLGSFPMPDGYGGELDYLLIELKGENPVSLKSLNEVASKLSLGSQTIHVHDIAGTNNTDVSIWAVTSRGVIRGKILADPVSFKTSRSCSFQQLLTVVLSQGLREGDSGSALIDARTGHFFGYVILGADGDCVAYALPSPTIMAKITTQFQHLPSFHCANEHHPSGSTQTAWIRPLETSSVQVLPTPPSSHVSPMSAGSSSSLIRTSHQNVLQRNMLDSRREVERLNSELQILRQMLKDSQGDMLGPDLVRDMQIGLSDQRFQGELGSLEAWFCIISAGQQSAALHTLLQNANPVQADYIRHILSQGRPIPTLSELIGASTTTMDTNPSTMSDSRQHEDENMFMDSGSAGVPQPAGREEEHGHAHSSLGEFSG